MSEEARARDYRDSQRSRYAAMRAREAALKGSYSAWATLRTHWDPLISKDHEWTSPLEHLEEGVVGNG